MATIGNQNEKRDITFTDWARKVANPILDPIAGFLMGLKIGPDLLTVAGMLGHLLTAYLIATGRFSWAAVSLMMIGPLDALDGALARKMSSEARPFGSFLDSTLDRVAEIILFGGFILYYHALGDTTFLIASYIALTGSFMVSYSRSKAETLGFDGAVGLLGRLERYILLISLLVIQQVAICLIVLAIFTYVTFVQRMLHVWRQSRNETK